jgi:hypothetical protein
VSVMLLGDGLFDLLVSAAVHANLTTPAEAPDLARALREANLRAFLDRHFDDPDALDDWDDLDEDERDDELADVVAWRDSYTHTPVPDADLTPAAVADAIETWHYQAGTRTTSTAQPWALLRQLAERNEAIPD